MKALENVFERAGLMFVVLAHDRISLHMIELSAHERVFSTCSNCLHMMLYQNGDLALERIARIYVLNNTT